MPATVPIEFRVKPHSISGAAVVEIRVQKEVVAVIYPDGEDGIKVVSAHMREVNVTPDPEFPIPQFKVKFSPRPYTLAQGEDGKIKLVREDES